MPDYVFNRVTIGKLTGLPNLIIPQKRLDEIRKALVVNSYAETIDVLQRRIAGELPLDDDETIEDVQKELEQAKQSKKKDYTNIFSFEAILPTPKDSQTFRNVGNLSSHSRFEKTKQNWYDWRATNWHTKWDSCEPKLVQRKGILVYEFQTAWSDPRPVIEALSKKFHVIVSNDYYFESFDTYIGRYVYGDGHLCENKRFDNDDGVDWGRVAEVFGLKCMREHGYKYDEKLRKWCYDEALCERVTSMKWKRFNKKREKLEAKAKAKAEAEAKAKAEA